MALAGNTRKSGCSVACSLGKKFGRQSTAVARTVNKSAVIPCERFVPYQTTATPPLKTKIASRQRTAALLISLSRRRPCSRSESTAPLQPCAVWAVVRVKASIDRETVALRFGGRLCDRCDCRIFYRPYESAWTRPVCGVTWTGYTPLTSSL